MVGDEQDEADAGLDELFAEGKAEEIPEVVDVGEGNDDEKDNLDGRDCEGADARVLPDPGEPTPSQIVPCGQGRSDTFRTDRTRSVQIG